MQGARGTLRNRRAKMRTFEKYQLAVGGTGIAMLAIAWWLLGPPDAEAAMYFIGMSLVATWLSLDIEKYGSLSLSFAVNVAAVLVSGPLVAGLAAAAGGMSREDIEAGKPAPTIMFNVGQLGLSGLAAGVVGHAIGFSLTGPWELPRFTVSTLAGALVIAATLLAVNLALVGVGVALKHEEPAIATMEAVLEGQAPALATQTFLGIVLACLIAYVGWWASALVLIPFISSWWSLGSYETAFESYQDTVRSLVDTIEAKDPYTRGHSERVAWYVREIAEQIELPALQIERLVWRPCCTTSGRSGYGRRP